MKTSIHSIVLLTALMGVGSAFADTKSLKSGGVTLTGGKIAPASELVMPLTTLMKLIKYTIQCKITDSNNAANQVVIGLSGDLIPGCASSSLGSISMNGTFVDINQAQVTLPGVNTMIEMTPVSAGCIQSIVFTNADQDDTISVDSCVATPVTK